MVPHIASCILAFWLLASPALASPAVPRGYLPQAGDLVFQSFPRNPLTEAIEGCTHSPLSHCGIVAAAQNTKGGKKAAHWVVIEAVGPVRETPLSEWVARGRERHLAVFRLKPPLVSKVPAILHAARQYAGRPYDSRFRWDDEAIYCSELVHKAIRDATGSTLGAMEKLGALDWQPYAETIRSLEGGPPPLERRMVTPVALANDARLERVFVAGYAVRNGGLVAP